MTSEEPEVLRVLTCGHGASWVSASLPKVWCPECKDMVLWVRGEWPLLGAWP